MFDVISDLNWLGIVLATVAYFILGALWFTPLFGALYDKAMGFSRPKKYKWGMIYYVMPAVSAFMVSLTTGALTEALALVELSDAIILGIVVGIGYTGAVSFNNAVNPKTPRPLLYGAVTGSYHLVGAILVSIIIILI